LSFLTNKGTTSNFPLHESQRIVEETNDTVLLEIYIHTTNDIIMELLKYGRNVKVVAPKSLVATMKERIAEMEENVQ
jgi:predicted DNA-binding transcriptional regulator YafY